MSQGFFAQFRGTVPDNNSSSFTSDVTASDMASRKRSRDANDIDGDVEIESASSSFRHNVPKRSKVALAAANGGSVVSDDEDEMDGYTQNGAYDEDDDENEGDENATVASLSDLEEGDDNVIDEVRATQFMEKALRVYKENIESEAGVVEEVVCRNFMCHNHLRLGLGPLINFIIGHNGSGKSAVLTALTMCLGGSAKATNRAANLKSLIKQGKETASLEVKLRNRGDDAYRPEAYGASITVERHFSRGNSSGWKIKGASGQVISSKKGDVEDILDYFALQLDNPINVLTQDMARQFLANSSAADKYKFFMRGTQLETLDRQYAVVEENLEKVQATLHTISEDVEMLEAKLHEAEAKKRRIEQAQKLRQKIKECEWQHAWAQVEEQEVDLEQKTREVQGAEESIHDKEEEAEGISGTYEGFNQSYEAIVRTVEQLRQQLMPVEEQRDAAKHAFQEAHDRLKEINAEQRTIKETITHQRKTIGELEAAARTERERIDSAEGEEHSGRLRKLEKLKSTAETAREEVERHNSSYDALVGNRDEAFHAFEGAKPLLARERDALGGAERQLSGLQRSQGRPFEAYPRNMDQLARAVDNETRWRYKPVGPMGRHIRLLKPEWSSQLEKTFGNTLNAFVVTNSEDQRLLRSIMKRVNCTSPDVLIGDSNRLETTGKTPEDPSLDTGLGVLNIDNDLVRNQIIINQAVEQLVLIPDRATANAFMFGPQKPRNVKVTIHFSNERGGGVRMEFSRAGQQKTTTIHPWKGSPRMQTDREEQIRHQRETVDHHKRLVDTADRAVREKQHALTQANQDIKRHEREAGKLKTEVQVAEDAVEEQNNEIESHRPQDGRLQELERQLNGAKTELNEHGRSFQDSVNQKDDQGKKNAEIKQRLDEAEREYQGGHHRVRDVEGRMQKLQQDRQDALLKKNQALQQIEFAKQTLTEFEQRRDAQKEKVQEYTGQAESISRRVPVEPGVTAAELDQRIAQLSRDYHNQERAAGGSRDELALAHAEAKRKYEQMFGNQEIQKGVEKALIDALKYRQYRWKLFRKMISVRARFTFKYLLSERNFRGEVLLNHREHTLDIEVEPDLTKASAKGRAAKSLSGGEKSFSTICLLLAIWEAMGSPIRCLDEFDVFMDSVNRAQSMTMMIQAARRAVGRQFILITPQSMNNVELGDDVKIHKMSDPERGQTALVS